MEIQPQRIIIADDRAVARTGLQLILDETYDLSIVDEARNGIELLDKIKKNNYNLVILDISMPGKDALDVLKEIKITFPLLPVVIFSMNSDEVYAFRMLKNGASAYINKETKPSHIIEILRIVLRGKKYISPHQAEIFAQDAVSFAKENTVTHELLTDREFQIFCLLANGISKTEIAEKLDISIHTLSNHRNNIMKKMKLTTNAELIRYAIQTRIIE